MNFDEYYYNVNNPASYTGSHRLLSKYVKRDAHQWLLAQDPYTLHRQKKRRFPRRKVMTFFIDQLWQIDLMDLSAISPFNDGNNFVLVCIDCFSRYAFAALARNKSALVVKDAFSSILERNLRRPVYVQSDKGREFLNAVFQQYLRESDIKFYTSENSDVKCSLVERLLRSLKERMWRMFSYSKSYRYLEHLDGLVRSYNHTIHSSIKVAPADVDVHNEKEIFGSQYEKPKRKIKKKTKNVLVPGDVVRISRSDEIFSKGYYPGWSKELFTVADIYPTLPKTYGIVDYSGEKVKGKFYTEELQKVNKKKEDKNIFEVEKILKTRKLKGKKQYLVRWSGYSSKHDSWVDEIVS